MFKTILCLKICGLQTSLFWGFRLFQLMIDRNLILEPCNIFGHFVPPEDRQTQVENSSKTKKTTASYSSGLDWESLDPDVVDSFGTQAVLAMCTTEGYTLGNPLD